MFLSTSLGGPSRTAIDLCHIYAYISDHLFHTLINDVSGFVQWFDSVKAFIVGPKLHTLIEIGTVALKRPNEVLV